MLFKCKTLHIDVVFRHSTFKVVQFFNHLTSLCKYSLKKSCWYYIMMMPGSKGQKAVHACMIRLLNLGPAKHEKVAIYVVNQRISNVCRIAGAASQRSNS